MPMPNTLPYDICSLNLEYVISKNKEIALTSNMLIIAFMFIIYCVYSNYSYKVRTMLFTINKYIELVDRMNHDQNVFDFNEPSQNILNPVALLEHYNSLEDAEDASGVRAKDPRMRIQGARSPTQGSEDEDLGCAHPNPRIRG